MNHLKTCGVIFFLFAAAMVFPIPSDAQPQMEPAEFEIEWYAYPAGPESIKYDIEILDLLTGIIQVIPNVPHQGDQDEKQLYVWHGGQRGREYQARVRAYREGDAPPGPWSDWSEPDIAVVPVPQD
jgi:hypothetical protein